MLDLDELRDRIEALDKHDPNRARASDRLREARRLANECQAILMGQPVRGVISRTRTRVGIGDPVIRSKPRVVGMPRG